MQQRNGLRAVASMWSVITVLDVAVSHSPVPTCRTFPSEIDDDKVSFWILIALALLRLVGRFASSPARRAAGGDQCMDSYGRLGLRVRSQKSR